MSHARRPCSSSSLINDDCLRSCSGSISTAARGSRVNRGENEVGGTRLRNARAGTLPIPRAPGRPGREVRPLARLLQASRRRPRGSQRRSCVSSVPCVQERSKERVTGLGTVLQRSRFSLPAPPIRTLTISPVRDTARPCSAAHSATRILHIPGQWTTARSFIRLSSFQIEHKEPYSFPIYLHPILGSTRHWAHLVLYSQFLRGNADTEQLSIDAWNHGHRIPGLVDKLERVLREQSQREDFQHTKSKALPRTSVVAWAKHLSYSVRSCGYHSPEPKPSAVRG